MSKEHHIQLEKCLVILTSQEINMLLQKDTELFKRALQRGKSLKRGNVQRQREKAKYEQEQGL